ncbi:MAG: AAA family ATPase [Salinarimonas sp.]
MTPHPPLLVAFAGLPGAGKTTIARALALRLGAVFLRIDTIEAGLAQSVLRIDPAEDAGYVVARALAEENLRQGLTVVVDGVNPIDPTRRAFAEVAHRAGVAILDVEIVCSDEEEHRRRVERRLADLPGQKLPTWADVKARRWEPFAHERLLVDTARLAVEEAVALIARGAATAGT